MNQGRLKLRQDAEVLLAEYAHLLVFNRPEPSIASDRLDAAHQRLHEQRDPEQLSLDVGRAA